MGILYPPARQQRAWYVPLSAAWFFLAWATSTSGSEILKGDLWWLMAGLNGALAALAIPNSRWRIQIIRFGTLMGVAYGIARGIIYLFNGFWSPLAVWTLFTVVAISAMTLPQRQDVVSGGVNGRDQRAT